MHYQSAGCSNDNFHYNIDNSSNQDSLCFMCSLNWVRTDLPNLETGSSGALLFWISAACCEELIVKLVIERLFLLNSRVIGLQRVQHNFHTSGRSLGPTHVTL